MKIIGFWFIYISAAAFYSGHSFAESMTTEIEERAIIGMGCRANSTASKKSGSVCDPQHQHTICRPGFWEGKCTEGDDGKSIQRETTFHVDSKAEKNDECKAGNTDCKKGCDDSKDEPCQPIVQYYCKTKNEIIEDPEGLPGIQPTCVRSDFEKQFDSPGKRIVADGCSL